MLYATNSTLIALIEDMTIVLDILDEVPSTHRGELLEWIKTAQS